MHHFRVPHFVPICLISFVFIFPTCLRIYLAYYIYFGWIKCIQHWCFHELPLNFSLRGKLLLGLYIFNNNFGFIKRFFFWHQENCYFCDKVKDLMSVFV